MNITEFGCHIYGEGTLESHIIPAVHKWVVSCGLDLKHNRGVISNCS